MNTQAVKTKPLVSYLSAVALAGLMFFSIKVAPATSFVVDTASDDSFDGNDLTAEQADGTGLSLAVANSILTSNVATRAGGGIEEDAAAGLGLTVRNSLLMGNNAGIAAALAAPGSGGGPHVTGPGDVDFEASSISENIAASEGGGLWNGTGLMTVDGGSISANTASGADRSLAL